MGIVQNAIQVAELVNSYKSAAGKPTILMVG